MVISGSKGNDYQFKLGDFGLARPFAQDTPVSVFSPLPHYMAPELCKGDHDHRVDLYNLGHVMLLLSDCIKETNGIEAVDPDFERLQLRLRSVAPQNRPIVDEVLEIAKDRLNGRN